MTITLSDLIGSVRGIGHPGQPNRPSSNFQVDMERDGWLHKTIEYRHSCMTNVAEINKQLEDKRFLTNRPGLERRKAFLLAEINVCHKMLTLFSNEMN